MPNDNLPNQNLTNDDTRKDCKTVFALDRDEKMRFLAGFFGNAAWAGVAAAGTNLRDQNTTQFWPANWAQVVYAIPMPFLAYAAYFGALFYKNDTKIKEAGKKSTAGFVSLILGIFFWNLAQHYGENYFYRHGLSDKNAGNAAAIITGLSDGAASAIFYDASLLLMREPEMLKRYAFFRTDCLISSFLFAIYFLTSSLGGAVWQLVFNMIFPNCAHTPKDCANPSWSNIASATAAVAFSVSAANYLGAVIYKCFALILQPSQSSMSEAQRLLPPPQADDDPPSSVVTMPADGHVN